MRRPGPGPGYEGKMAEPSRRVLQRRFPDLVVSKHKSVLRELMTKGKALANPGVVAKGVQHNNAAGEGRMKPKDRVLKLKKPIARKQTKKAAEMTLGSPQRHAEGPERGGGIYDAQCESRGEGHEKIHRDIPLSPCKDTSWEERTIRVRASETKL